MPRRKKAEIPDDDYFGCVEYGMDDYDDPLDHMSPGEIEELANYVQMSEGGGYPEYDSSDDDDDSPPPNYQMNEGSLYPREFDGPYASDEDSD